MVAKLRNKSRSLIILAVLGLSLNAESLLAAAVGEEPVLAEALRELSQESPEICRGAIRLNREFHAATRGMTEKQRRSYFALWSLVVVHEGKPAPRPPPPPGSALSRALEVCASR